MPPKTISLAKDFSPFPAGRTYEDGDFSGERFRVEFLVPALKAHPLVVVDLSGTLGIGVSFLEEAFEGLLETFTFQELLTKLRIQSDLPSDKHLAWEKIRRRQLLLNAERYDFEPYDQATPKCDEPNCTRTLGHPGKCGKGRTWTFMSECKRSETLYAFDNKHKFKGGWKLDPETGLHSTRTCVLCGAVARAGHLPSDPQIRQKCKKKK